MVGVHDKGFTDLNELGFTNSSYCLSLPHNFNPN